MGNYVVIGKELSFSDAFLRVKGGGDVFAANKSAAHTLATTASGGKTPVGPEIDNGKINTVGYYWHYHLSQKNGSHIFYL